jgi:hypothetical protein
MLSLDNRRFLICHVRTTYAQRHLNSCYINSFTFSSDIGPKRLPRGA